MQNIVLKINKNLTLFRTQISVNLEQRITSRL